MLSSTTSRLPSTMMRIITRHNSSSIAASTSASSARILLPTCPAAALQNQRLLQHHRRFITSSPLSTSSSTAESSSSSTLPTEPNFIDAATAEALASGTVDPAAAFSSSSRSSTPLTLDDIGPNVGNAAPGAPRPEIYDPSQSMLPVGHHLARPPVDPLKVVHRFRYMTRENRNWALYAMFAKDRKNVITSERKMREAAESQERSSAIERIAAIEAGSTGIIVTPTHLSHLHVQVQYHSWSNTRVLDSLAKLSDEEFGRNCGLFFGSIHATLAHILAADRLWLARLEEGVNADTSELNPLWADDCTQQTLESFAPNRRHLVQAIREVNTRLINFTAKLDERYIVSRFEYKNTSGKVFKASKSLILNHIVNHGTHHRSQITTGLTLLGHKAPSLDLLYMLNDAA